jgi:hypothetical protein
MLYKEYQTLVKNLKKIERKYKIEISMIVDNNYILQGNNGIAVKQNKLNKTDYENFIDLVSKFENILNNSNNH